MRPRHISSVLSEFNRNLNNHGFTPRPSLFVIAQLRQKITRKAEVESSYEMLDGNTKFVSNSFSTGLFKLGSKYGWQYVILTKNGTTGPNTNAVLDSYSHLLSRTDAKEPSPGLRVDDVKHPQSIHLIELMENSLSDALSHNAKFNKQEFPLLNTHQNLLGLQQKLTTLELAIRNQPQNSQALALFSGVSDASVRAPLSSIISVADTLNFNRQQLLSMLDELMVLSKNYPNAFCEPSFIDSFSNYLKQVSESDLKACMQNPDLLIDGMISDRDLMFKNPLYRDASLLKNNKLTPTECLSIGNLGNQSQRDQYKDVLLEVIANDWANDQKIMTERLVERVGGSKTQDTIIQHLSHIHNVDLNETKESESTNELYEYYSPSPYSLTP